LDKQLLQLEGPAWTRIPLEVYEFTYLLGIKDLVLSDICGVTFTSLDIALFMVIVELKALTITKCPYLELILLSSKGGEVVNELEKLNFSNNPSLMNLPLAEIVHKSSIKELFCLDCPNLWSPPHEIASQGGAATLNFVREVFHDGGFNPEMTLFLLGDGEAGKTSVFKSLKSHSNAAELIKEDLRTVGIDLESWQVQPTNGGPPIHFQVCDLAGQAVYEATHQFLLQLRAVYILVWRAVPHIDSRRNVLFDRVLHWMDSLQMRVPGARLLLVVTHIDTVDAAMLNALCSGVKDTVKQRLAQLKETANQGRLLKVLNDGESLRVNCLLGEGVAALREQLISFTQSMPWFQEQLPKSFISVRGSVSNMVKEGTRFIPAHEWVDLAKRHGMDGSMLQVGTRFMHDTGVMHFFGDVTTLSELPPSGAERTCSSTVHPPHHVKVSASRKGLIRHCFGFFGRKYQRDVEVIDVATLGKLLPSGAERTFSSTVYLSPHFMVSAMKGLIRHDRQSLQDFLAEKGPRLMLRRTNRFNATGRLHEQLIPFLWPSSDASREYWAWVRDRNEGERALWSEDVVKEEDDLTQVTQLLEGFNLMVKPEGESEYLVPGVLPPAKMQGLSAHAFPDQKFLKLKTTHTYAMRLPPGAFQRIVVQVARQATWSDFSGNKAVFYLIGNIAVLDTAWVSSSDVSPSSGSIVCWSSSGKGVHDMIGKAVKTMEDFFPGLCRSGLQGEEGSHLSFSEPIQILILAAIDEEASYIETAVKSASKRLELDLAIERHVPPSTLDLQRMRQSGQVPPSAPGLERIRVVLICLSPAVSSSHECCEQIKRYLKEGHVRVVLVLLSGCDSINSLQFKGEMKFLEQELDTYQPFDLRACSLMVKQIESQVKAELRAQIMNQIAKEEEDRKLKHEKEIERRRSGTISIPSFEPISEEDKEKRLEEVSSPEVKDRIEKQKQMAESTIKDKLMLQILWPLLRDWRAQPASQSATGSTRGTSSDRLTSICKCGYAFDRQNCQRLLEKFSEISETSRSLVTFACPQCKKNLQFEHRDLSNLVSLPEVKPCPYCQAEGKKGLFEARESRLQMEEEHERRNYSMQCHVCEKEVSLFDVFPPEVYVSAAFGSDIQFVKTLLKEVEAEADVLIWIARGGSTDKLGESRRAASLANVTLVLLSEAYAASLACAEELQIAVQAGKLMVPVLLPDLVKGSEMHENATKNCVEEYWGRLVQHRKDSGKADVINWMLFSGLTPVFLPEQNMTKINMVPIVNKLVSKITSRLHRAVKLEIYSDLSRSGVRVSYFKVFIEMFGGREKLEGLTTLDVMIKCVLPQTEATHLSWCEHLLSEGNSGNYVATAEIFLSHAWSYKFLDVVDAVERHFKGSKKDPYIWFDIFSVSQHKSESRDIKWWQSTFLNAVGCMGQVLMVMHPWDNPTTLTRVWCIFEIYASEATQSRFCVVMTEDESNRLVADMCKDPEALLRTLSTISCEASDATKKEDKYQILEVIQRSVGFVRLDSMVSRKVEEAVYQEIRSKLDAARRKLDSKAAATVGLTLGNLCRLMRNHTEAEQIFRECLDLAPRAEESNAFRLEATYGLAVANSHLGNRKVALEQYEMCRELIKSNIGKVKDLMQEVISGYALECFATGQQKNAESLAEECLEMSRTEKRRTVEHNLALLRLEQGRAADAYKLICECLAARGVKVHLEVQDPSSKTFFETALKEELWNPDTLDALAVLARVQELTEMDEAKIQLKQLLALCERFLGLEHANTTNARSSLLRLAQAAICVAAAPTDSSNSNRTIQAITPSVGGSGHLSAEEDTQARDWAGIVRRFYSHFPEVTKLQLRAVDNLDWSARVHLALEGIRLHTKLVTLDVRCALEPIVFFSRSIPFEENLRPNLPISKCVR
jgi:GTPase SAR1 family protein/tetratricopeptide (TPR) repeat protein